MDLDILARSPNSSAAAAILSINLLQTQRNIIKPHRRFIRRLGQVSAYNPDTHLPRLLDQFCVLVQNRQHFIRARGRQEEHCALGAHRFVFIERLAIRRRAKRRNGD
jgi:hypothetical protein